MQVCRHPIRRNGAARLCVRPAGHSGMCAGQMLAAVSPRRRAEEREYRKLRAAFLEGHDRCEFPEGCEARSTVVHHRRGRSGERLLQVAWWAASCAFHNDYAETETGHSLAIGWLVRIEGVA